MKRFLSQCWLVSLLGVVLFLGIVTASVENAVAEDTVEKGEKPKSLEELRDIVYKHTREVPSNLGRAQVPEDELEDARLVFEAGEEILARNITEEFRIWTLKRQTIALVILAYEETPRYFPVLTAQLERLDEFKACKKIAVFAEKHVLSIGTNLLVQPMKSAKGKPVTIDAEALTEWYINFARNNPGPESLGMLKNFMTNIQQISSPIQRDRRLGVIAPMLMDYYKEINNRETALAMQNIVRRVTLPGKPMKFVGYNLEGKPFDVETLQGKVVLVQFWGTWCIPCRKEIPHLIKLYEKYRSRGFEIVGVNTGVKGDTNPDTIRRFVQDTDFGGGKKITWPIIVDALTAKENLITMSRYYGIEELPVLFLVGRDGNVLNIHPLSEYLETEIQEALTPRVTLDDLTEEERAQAEAALQQNSEE